MLEMVEPTPWGMSLVDQVNARILRKGSPGEKRNSRKKHSALYLRGLQAPVKPSGQTNALEAATAPSSMVLWGGKKVPRVISSTSESSCYTSDASCDLHVQPSVRTQSCLSGGPSANLPEATRAQDPAHTSAPPERGAFPGSICEVPRGSSSPAQAASSPLGSGVAVKGPGSRHVDSLNSVRMPTVNSAPGHLGYSSDGEQWTSDASGEVLRAGPALTQSTARHPPPGHLQYSPDSDNDCSMSDTSEDLVKLRQVGEATVTSEPRPRQHPDHCEGGDTAQRRVVSVSNAGTTSARHSEDYANVAQSFLSGRSQSDRSHWKDRAMEKEEEEEEEEEGEEAPEEEGERSLKALESKLELLTVQRQLSAVKCQTFLDTLELFQSSAKAKTRPSPRARASRRAGKQSLGSQPAFLGARPLPQRRTTCSDRDLGSPHGSSRAQLSPSGAQAPSLPRWSSRSEPLLQTPGDAALAKAHHSSQTQPTSAWFNRRLHMASPVRQPFRSPMSIGGRGEQQTGMTVDGPPSNESTDQSDWEASRNIPRISTASPRLFGKAVPRKGFRRGSLRREKHSSSLSFTPSPKRSGASVVSASPAFSCPGPVTRAPSSTSSQQQQCPPASGGHLQVASRGQVTQFSWNQEERRFGGEDEGLLVLKKEVVEGSQVARVRMYYQLPGNQRLIVERPVQGLPRPPPGRVFSHVAPGAAPSDSRLSASANRASPSVGLTDVQQSSFSTWQRPPVPPSPSRNTAPIPSSAMTPPATPAGVPFGSPRSERRVPLPSVDLLQTARPSGDRVRDDEALSASLSSSSGGGQSIKGWSPRTPPALGGDKV